MNVNVRTKDIKIAEATEVYAEEKVGSLDRYLPNISDIKLDIIRHHARKGPDRVIAQITVRHERGAIIRAEERGLLTDGDKSVLSILNQAVDTMQRRISRFKGKRKSKRERSYEKYRMTVEEVGIAEELPTEIEHVYDDIPEADATDELIYRRKTVEVSPMSELEAIEQMELLGHDFFMFLNTETNKVSVTYKRGEGGYGVLIPE